jgi:nicotinate phosphoribosyltransferase
MGQGLVTDLYELTMAAGFVAAGKGNELGTFELFVRRLPRHRNFLIAAGLEQAVDYLLNLCFSSDEIAYLRSLPQFSRAPREFFDLLAEFRFTGDVHAVPEGTPVFAGEPIVTVRAPLPQAQIPETFLLATIGFQTMIASKAARVVEAAAGRRVIEFGTRRAHSPEAGVLAARASYIGGCCGTSNTAAGFRYHVPVFGTSAHSWVQAFHNETAAFRQLQDLLGPDTVQLIDTYDTLEGARRAARLGEPLWGVRLDSGDLHDLSRQVRRILDGAGMQNAKIMVSSDLNEYRILEIVAANLPIDSMGVGTDLSTSADAPNLGAVYKLAELEDDAGVRPVIKLSEEKQTWPGAKQVFRYADHDVIGCAGEAANKSRGPCQMLLRPIVRGGQLVEALPTAAQSREYARQCIERLPSVYRKLSEPDDPYPVEYSANLRQLGEIVRAQVSGAVRQ